MAAKTAKTGFVEREKEESALDEEDDVRALRVVVVVVGEVVARVGRVTRRMKKRRRERWRWLEKNFGPIVDFRV